MIKKWFAYLTGGLVLTSFFGLHAQEGFRTGMIENESFDQEVHELLRFSVPTMSVSEAYEAHDKYTFLDTRKKEEYAVSRIPGAIFLGYKNPHWETVRALSKDAPVILYCSVGYRSEKVAEKLRKKGFTEVYNLYGSIFEWANRGLPLETPDRQPTERLHTYNRKWSRYVSNPEIEKTW